jgi:hypothetical protein
MKTKFLSLLFYIFFATNSFSAVVVTTANLDLCGAFPTSYRPIPDLVITEALVGDFAIQAASTLILTAPVGFEFNSTSASAVFIGGNDFTAAAINSVTNSTTITITITVTGITKFDVLTIVGLKVRAVANTTGNIQRLLAGGTAVIAGDAAAGGVNHGTLNRPACFTPVSSPCASPLITDKYCSSGFIHSNTVGVTTFAANTFSTFGCGNIRQFEVFFSFVATTADYEITGFAGTIGGNSEISILQNTGAPCPGGPATWVFIDASCPAWGTAATFTGLTIGQTYYLAVDHSGNSTNRGTFDICLNPLPNIVAISGTGITCATAININSSGGLPFTHTSTTLGKGNDWRNSCADPFVGAGYGDGPDMFYSYTSTGNEYLTYELIPTGCPAAGCWPVVSVIRTCPALNTAGDVTPVTGVCVVQGNFGAADGTHSMASKWSGTNAINCTPIYLSAPGTYYFVVDNYPSPASFNYTFIVNSLSRANNDGCLGAGNVFGGVTLSGNNAGCNYSYGADDPNSGMMCALSTENTAWFQFKTEATATSANFNFSNVSGSIQYGVFSGACGGPYTKAGSNTSNNPPLGRSLANDPCFASNAATQSFTVTGLSPNTNYWLAVDGNAGINSTFDVFGGTGVLPITLLNFDAKYIENKVIINWATMTETNNNFFAIERSSDGFNFEIIATIKGAGNSTSTIKYQTIDHNPLSGINYYRLKQVDFDGKYQDSKIISVKTFFSENTLTVYPNPVTQNEFNISLSGLQPQEKVLVVLTDILGNEVYSKVNFSDEDGSFVDVVTTEPKLPSGIYLVIGSTKNSIYKRKIVVK